MNRYTMCRPFPNDSDFTRMPRMQLIADCFEFSSPFQEDSMKFPLQSKPFLLTHLPVIHFMQTLFVNVRVTAATLVGDTPVRIVFTVIIMTIQHNPSMFLSQQYTMQSAYAIHIQHFWYPPYWIFEHPIFKELSSLHNLLSIGFENSQCD